MSRIQLKRIWRYIRKKKRGRFSLFFLALLTVLSLLTPFIANDVPLICRAENGITFPVVKKIIQNTSHTDASCIWSINPPIPYSQKSIDIKNGRFTGPFAKQNFSSLKERHWLGTDALGRDTLAGLLYGSSIAIRIGFFAALLSFILGMFLGTIAAYFGNDKLKINYAQLFILGITLVLFMYQISYGFFFGYENDFLLEAGTSLTILILCALAMWQLNGKLPSSFTLPIDNMLLWVLEIYKSIPNIFFILILLSLFVRSGVINLIFIIGLVIWPIVARYTRAEILKLKEENFIKSAEVSGNSSWNIILRHLLLNAMGPALVSFAFSFSSAILLEASLSFLGLGLSVEEVSWGSMLAEVRNNYKAWWLALFPGIAIFLVISSLNYIGEMVGEFFGQN